MGCYRALTLLTIGGLIFFNTLYPQKGHLISGVSSNSSEVTLDPQFTQRYEMPVGACSSIAFKPLKSGSPLIILPFKFAYVRSVEGPLEGFSPFLIFFKPRLPYRLNFLQSLFEMPHFYLEAGPFSGLFLFIYSLIAIIAASLHTASRSAPT